MLTAPVADAISDIPDRQIQTTLPGAARSRGTGSVPVRTRGHRLRRIAGMLRRVPKTGGRYHDPLFERPDAVEDDYYRFRNQPCG
jgi:hypothetical protein